MTVITDPVNTPEAWSARAYAIEEPWTACGWSYEGQVDRMEAVVEALDPQPDEWLLDFGCGTGELADYLAFHVHYVGFDTAAGMVERASRGHGGETRTFTTWHPAGRFDLVACVGPFNLVENWSKEATWHTIRHLWDTTGCRAIAVSLYAGNDVHCLRYTRGECEAHGRDLGYQITIDQPRPNDLLLVVRR